MAILPVPLPVQTMNLVRIVRRLSPYLIASLLVVPACLRAQVIFTENFNSITGGNAGTQYQSGNTVYYSATLPGWDTAGLNTVHAVDLGTGNFAPMIYAGTNPSQTNVITLSSGIAANTAGANYSVTVDYSAAVYSNGAQTTASGDHLLISVINGSGTVIGSGTFAPGMWTGNMSFTTGSFTYIGDGSGIVRIVVGAAEPTTDRFAGAVDNLSVALTAIPEVSSYAILAGFGALGLAGWRRRSRAA